MSVEPRTAVVTGASSGIGEATARRLDHDGWRLLLVARRADRLEALSHELRDAQPLPLDLTDPDAPQRVRERAEREAALQLLALQGDPFGPTLRGNAGASWRSSFDEGGFDNVRQTMALNFDAAVRLTEALLPLLRRSAPSAIVNVSSVAGRVGMGRGGAYAASKFALAGWSEALFFEERRHGVHVGLVLPGFIATEGMPQSGLRRNPMTRWIVSKPERVAGAIVSSGPGGRAERYVPRPYALAPVARAVAPWLWRRLGGGRRG